METIPRQDENKEQTARRDGGVDVIPFQRRKPPERPRDNEPEAPWEPPPAA